MSGRERIFFRGGGSRGFGRKSGRVSKKEVRRGFIVGFGLCSG